MSSILEQIDEALGCLNQKHGDTEWKPEHCECDHSVGITDCFYCNIHRTLTRCRYELSKMRGIDAG